MPVLFPSAWARRITRRLRPGRACVTHSKFPLLVLPRLAGHESLSCLSLAEVRTAAGEPGKKKTSIRWCDCPRNLLLPSHKPISPLLVIPSLSAIRNCTVICRTESAGSFVFGSQFCAKWEIHSQRLLLYVASARQRRSQALASSSLDLQGRLHHPCTFTFVWYGHRFYRRHCH